MHNTLLRISPHIHTGKLRPHEHTSYIPLGFIVAVVGVILMQFSIISVAGASPGPQSGSIGLTGILPATPPTTAATITAPTNNQHFSTSPVTVAGTCPTGTLVEIFKNDIFAGSTPCTNTGTFSLSIDLLYGSNSLIARVYDSLNQPGPDSAPVLITYDVLPPQTANIISNSFYDRQILLETDAVYRGTFPGENLTMPLTILGGVPAFAVNVEWGDATNTIISRSDNIAFDTTHVYEKPGTYQITIQASDTQGHIAFLQIAAIVNGQPSVSGSGSTNGSASTPETNKLIVLWPLYIIIIAVVIAFWLGEQREKRVLLASHPSWQMAK